MVQPLLSVNSMSPGPDHRQPVTCAANAENLRSDLITVRGIVVPIDWDKKGNVAALALSTYDEDEYLIEKDESGAALEAFLRQEVEVVGTVREAEGRQVITVKRLQSRSWHDGPEKNENAGRGL